MRLLITATFHGNSVNKTGDQILKFNIAATEIGEAVKVLMTINKRVNVGCVLEDRTRQRLGAFMFDKFQIDKDGEMTLALRSDVDSVLAEAATIRAMIQKIVTLIIVTSEPTPEESPEDAPDEESDEQEDSEEAEENEDEAEEESDDES